MLGWYRLSNARHRKRIDLLILPLPSLNGHPGYVAGDSSLAALYEAIRLDMHGAAPR